MNDEGDGLPECVGVFTSPSFPVGELDVKIPVVDWSFDTVRCHLRVFIGGSTLQVEWEHLCATRNGPRRDALRATIWDAAVEAYERQA